MARPRDDVVLDRMLDLAQRLYGERGVEGVSLREISAGAGSANPTAVQYHFQNVDGLIGAILEKQMPAVERARAAHVNRLIANNAVDARGLVRALFEPMLNHLDEGGRRSYPRFVLALLSAPDFPARWGKLFVDLQPTAVSMVDMLVELTGLPRALLLERQRLTAIMVLTSVFNRNVQFADRDLDDALIDNAIEMAAAALVAPCDRRLLEIPMPS